MISQPPIDDLYTSINGVWRLIKDANVYEARATSEQLVRDIKAMITSEDKVLLRVLAHACFACGYTTSMNSRNRQAFSAIAHYKRMEDVAHILDDPSLLAIACTYQGDTFRRSGNMEKALTCLLSAYDISPHVDLAAHGNCAHLLARVYLAMNNTKEFERLIAEAEEIAQGIHPTENSTHGQYSLGTVYLEYARAYCKRRNLQKAMDYLDLAEKALPPSTHWQTLLSATRADVLTRCGDRQQGTQLAIQSVELCYEHGNMRLLERIHALLRFLTSEAMEISNAIVAINESIHGTFDL